MEHNKEGRYRERKRTRWSTTRRRGVIGRERERDGAQQEGGEIYGEKESEMEHNRKEGRYSERKRARWSTTRRGDIGRERERDGAQQDGEI